MPSLKGYTAARLYTPPLRPLNRHTSLGYQAAAFQDLMGEPWLPWQRWTAIHALETLPGGRLRFRIVLVIVARQNGKSQLKRGVTLWRMYMRGDRVVGAAQDIALARDQWNMAQETIDANPDLAAEVTKVSRRTGDEWFRLANGARYGIKAANKKAGRGGSADEANIDELRTQTDWKAWAALSKVTQASDDGQVWAMSNAGDDESVVLNQLRERALAGLDPTIGIFEYSAPYDTDTGFYCDLDDVTGWRHANPGLGYIISEPAIRSGLGDPPDVFRAEVLCQRVANLTAAVDMGAWKDCADAGTIGKGARIGACFDVAPDGKHATLAIAAKQRDGRIRVQIAQAWTAAEIARGDLDTLLARLKPARTGWYSTGPAAEFAPMLRARKDTEELTGMRVAEACMGFAGLVRARQIVHAGEPLLDAHVSAAQKLPSGDGWRFTRAGHIIGGHVDAAYAAAGAVQVVLTMPEQGRPRIRVVG